MGQSDTAQVACDLAAGTVQVCRWNLVAPGRTVDVLSRFIAEAVAQRQQQLETFAFDLHILIKMAMMWEVVGGADKGGIIVREGSAPCLLKRFRHLSVMLISQVYHEDEQVAGITL